MPLDKGNAALLNLNAEYNRYNKDFHNTLHASRLLNSLKKKHTETIFSLCIFSTPLTFILTCDNENMGTYV